MNFEKIIQSNLFEIEHFNFILNKIIIYTSGGLTFFFFSGTIIFFNHILFDINDKWIILLIPHFILSLNLFFLNIGCFLLSFIIFIISIIYKFITKSLFKLLTES